LWVIQLNSDQRPIRIIYGEYGKWIGKSLVLRKVVTRSSLDGSGKWRIHKLRRMPVVFQIPPDMLWYSSSFLYSGVMLSPFKIVSLVTVFTKYGLPLVRLKIAFVDILAIPLLIFCLSVFAAGAGWRYRSREENPGRLKVFLMMLVLPFIIYFILLTLRRLFMAIEVLGQYSSFLSYFFPVFTGVVFIFASFYSLNAGNKSLK